MTTDGDDLDRSIDALYSVPPETFVADREALVRQLRAAKRRDEAATVHALALPTVAAWAVNQAVRRAPELAEQLLRGAGDLVAAQRQALEQGDASWLRKAQADRRTVLRKLVDVAREVLTEHDRKADQHLDEVASMLEAGSLDPDSAESLRLGRLAAAPQPTSTSEQLDPFAALFAPGMADAPPATARPRARPQRQRRSTEPQAHKAIAEHPDDSRHRQAQREAQAELDDALAERQRARTRVAGLADRSERVTADVERAKQTVADFERQLSDARRSLENAEAEQAQVAAEAEEAEQQERGARERVDRAQARVDQLSDR